MIANFEQSPDWPQSKEDVLSQKTSCETLVRDVLTHIEKRHDLNAFLSVFSERALIKARLIDEKVRSGKAGKLAGLLLSVKDNIALAGEKLTCGS